MPARHSHRDLVEFARRLLAKAGLAPALARATAETLAEGDLLGKTTHGLALLPAYERIATARNVDVYAAWFSSCRPLLASGAADRKPADPPTCDDFNRGMLRAIDAIDPEIVILNAYWTYPSLDVAAPLDDQLIDDGAVGVANGLLAREEAARLRAAVSRLPAKQRMVLELRVFDDLPFREVAELADCSENAAKVNFHHALTRLRELLKESP